MVVGSGHAVEYKNRNQQELVSPERLDPGAGGDEPGSAAKRIQRNQHDRGVLHPKFDEVERMVAQRTAGGNQRVRSARDAPKGEGQQDFGAASGQVNDREQEADRAQVAGERGRQAPHAVGDLVKVNPEVERHEAVAQDALGPQAQVVVRPSHQHQE